MIPCRRIRFSVKLHLPQPTNAVRKVSINAIRKHIYIAMYVLYSYITKYTKHVDLSLITQIEYLSSLCRHHVVIVS